MSSVTPLPVYGVDPDRTQTTDLVTVVRRRGSKVATRSTRSARTRSCRI